MNQYRRVFQLPRHPRRGPQRIIVERENTGSVWNLVIDKKKAKPLPGLNNPMNPKQVLAALEKVSGESAVFDFVAQGYSLET